MGRWAILLLLAGAAWAANFRLYLKDGTYQVVREYKIVEDRVQYYSTERSEWEEIPLDLADLKRTESERKDVADKRAAEEKAAAEEDQAERERRAEIARIPGEAGAYHLLNGEIRPLKIAETKIVTDKKSSILSKVSPIPIFAGKATVEVGGESSAYVVTEKRPEFYFRLSEEQRFALVRLKPKKNARIVENVTIAPVVKEMVEEAEIIETFRQQVGEGLYKIWPTAELAAGEYALIEYTEGKVNLQVWDFSLRLK